MRRIAVVVVTVVGVLALMASAQASAGADVRNQVVVPEKPVKPLAKAHAHNDYEHRRPLLDALDAGFTSVEADIYLVDGQLLVGHDRDDLMPSRTLQKLYLDPLAARTKSNRGTVYPGYHGLFQLLVDVKVDGEKTYAALDKVLRSTSYASLFTRYAKGVVKQGAVTVVISGERARTTMTKQKDRLAFYDGRIIDKNDLGPGADRRLAPLVSDNWSKLFAWKGSGAMPADQRTKLRKLVATAHKAGQRVRFWETPDKKGAARDAVWSELVSAGVDHLNTDDLIGLRDFLNRR